MRRRILALATGVAAVGSKELRGRMRGPRAFIALTFYLTLLALFTVMVYLLQRQAAASQAAFGGGNPYVSAQVGQAVFATLLLLQVLLVVFLAPAATSGAISLEREKQTLDLLTATPISTLAIVLGKLSSALAFVIVLILASIPLTAVVFVLGGVAPEDIVRGYVVLIVTALGFGSLGLFLSSMTRRTQSATVLTYLGVLVLTVGTGATWYFWDQMAGEQQATNPIMREMPADDVSPEAGVAGPAAATASPGIPKPPEALLWLNPIVAAADVVCGTDVNPYSIACQLVGGVTGKVPGDGFVVVPGVNVGPAEPGIDLPARGVQPDGAVWVEVARDAAPITKEEFATTSTRDSFWPQAAVAWLVMSLVLVLVSVQLVSPTRRWRIFRRRSHREIQA